MKTNTEPKHIVAQQQQQQQTQNPKSKNRSRSKNTASNQNSCQTSGLRETSETYSKSGEKRSCGGNDHREKWPVQTLSGLLFIFSNRVTVHRSGSFSGFFLSNFFSFKKKL